MELHRYRITGIVQGVGFRPFVHKLCEQENLNGWILNDSNGVLIELEGEYNSIIRVISELENNPPQLAKIDKVIKLSAKVSSGLYSAFSIRNSVKEKKTNTIIPPDSYVCEDCIKELFDPANRRYHYPFINCTNCGPRYSIIDDMPYDRKNTTMKAFSMCPDCEREYHNIADRRYHAQPIACPVCGPKLELCDRKGIVIETPDIIDFCKQELRKGKIIAVKSIGGFHLAANAQCLDAIQLLRTRKKRDSKPFALMVKDIETAEIYAEVSEIEKKVLNSPERPIVLLKKKKGTLPEEISPNNPNYGIMLPSAPLHYLLLDDKELPVLIMTSGNISKHPIIYQNEIAIKKLSNVADYFLMNNRDIHTGIDDSIVKCTYGEDLDEPILSFVRRSRGYAPYPIKLRTHVAKILAMGPELKTTIALSKNDEVYVSQHIGDVKNDETFLVVNRTASKMQKLLSIDPLCVACDLHPGFRTTTYLQEQSKLPLELVQHHHAHMVSCMAENGLEQKVIGVIFDGTGYGTDDTIWGGEFLVGDYLSFERVAHIKSFYLLGGDKAVQQPFRIALDLLYRTYGAEFLNLNVELLKNFSQQELNVYYKMAENKINAFETTSMGRLFDGIAALLNYCLYIKYEAQAAIMLESLLERNLEQLLPYSYAINEKESCYEFDYRPLVVEIVNNLINQNETIEVISRRFHSTIVSMTCELCVRIRRKSNINDVVLSGGVFMNEYLFYNTLTSLKSLSFHVYYHNMVPTNDGGISLGQILVADARRNQ